MAQPSSHGALADGTVGLLHQQQSPALHLRRRDGRQRPRPHWAAAARPPVSTRAVTLPDGCGLCG
eukprot:8692749-Alexandrium_andersonii.AAC.1